MSEITRYIGKQLRLGYWWLWLHKPRPGGWSREIAAAAQHEEDILRVCTIYPKRVDYSSMEKALTHLNLNPALVYLKLAEGARIAELDAALQEVAEPW